MAETAQFVPGNYRYIRGPFQYSAGVAAEAGFRIERARFARPLPIAAGFDAIQAYLGSLGRPATALCACELRSPAPFTDQGFIDFNRAYVGTLEAWQISAGDENPVARSNVCPELNKPPEPCFQAFSYTVPAASQVAGRSFVIAGSGEANEGPGSYAQRTVRLGDTSPEGMREKALHVLAAMETRMSALGASWSECTVSQVYTVHDLHPFFADEIVRRGAAQGGLTWYYARPPVQGLEYEMDVRGVPAEHVI